MAGELTEVRTIIRQFLNDEFVEGSEQDFTDDELDLYIDDVRTEISERIPYEVKEELTTAASRDLDISTIEDLIEVDRVEFPIDNDPRDFRNISVFGTTLTIDIDTKPTADEDIYLFCHKVHQLTEVVNTLSPQLQRLLVAGVVAKASLGWVNKIKDQVREALIRVQDINIAVSAMSGRVGQAIEDLSSGRDLGFNKIYVGGNPLGDYINQAGGEIRNANSGYLAQSQGFTRELTSRLSISGVINSYQTWGNNKLVLYQRDLKRMTKPRTYRTYPTD